MAGAWRFSLKRGDLARHFAPATYFSPQAVLVRPTNLTLHGDQSYELIFALARVALPSPARRQRKVVVARRREMV